MSSQEYVPRQESSMPELDQAPLMTYLDPENDGDCVKVTNDNINDLTEAFLEDVEREKTTKITPTSEHEGTARVNKNETTSDRTLGRQAQDNGQVNLFHVNQISLASGANDPVDNQSFKKFSINVNRLKSLFLQTASRLSVMDRNA